MEFKGYEYIDVSTPLLEAEMNGVRLRWKGGSHFNEERQRGFGGSISIWMIDDLKLAG